MSAVNVSTDDGIARIELCRPDRHNAFDTAMKDQLAGAIAQLVDDAAVRCVIVCGAGKSFSSGADLAMFEAMSAAAMQTFMLEAGWAFRRLERLGVPVIAEVTGYCLGGGLELALHCDMVVCAEDAVLGFPEATIGLITTVGSITRLAAAVGFVRAKELVLRGRRLTGSEACAIGLVTEAVPESQTRARAETIAREVARFPAQGLAAAKHIFRRHLGDAAAAWVGELEAFETLAKMRKEH